MTTPTAAQLSRLRTRPHRTKAYLSIFKPRVVLSAQLNMPTVAKGDRALTVTAISGTMADVRPGMTVYLGTTAGGRQKGRLRVKNGAGAVLTVAENSVAWVNGWYLTVVEFFEPWAVFPRIVVQNKTPVFYKDYDLTYTSEGRYMKPVVHMGPHYATFLDPITQAAQVWFTSTGSFDPTDGLAPTGTLWDFGEGAITPTGSANPYPGYVTFSGAGHYTVFLEEWTSYGVTGSGYRHISIYDRPENGPNRPIVEWGFEGLRGSRDDGGYEVDIWLREQAFFPDVVEGALVIIFTESWEGGVSGKVGGNAENRGEILFTGYIEDGTVGLDPVSNRLEFTAKSVTGIMERLAAFSDSYQSRNTANKWYKIYNMTVDKAIIQTLHWQSTILSICDFFPTNDTKGVEYIDFERTDLFSAAQGILESTLGARMVADRQGSIYCEVEANLVPTGSSRDFPVALDITRQDWAGKVDIDFRMREDVSYIEMGGIAYTGPQTGTNSAFLSGAPGIALHDAGTTETISGLVVLSQDQLNELSGNGLARANAEFPNVDLDMAGDYRLLDIAPIERVTMDLAPRENFRGFEWVDKPFFVKEISYDYEAESQWLRNSVTLEEETSGPPGETITIPAEAPYQDWKLPSWDIEFPPLIPLPGLLPEVVPPTGIGDYVYGLFNGIYVKTSNFWSHTGSGPTWEIVNVPSSVTGTASVQNLMFWLSPTDPANQVYIGNTDGGVNFIGRVITAFDSPTPGAQEWWSLADCATHLGVSTQRRLGTVRHMPALGGYMIGIGGQALAGQPPKWVEGATAGAWSSYSMNGGGYPQCGNPRDYWHYCGGTTIVAATDGEFRRSTNLGRNWTALYAAQPGNDVYYCETATPYTYLQSNPGGGMRMYFHPNAMIGVTSANDPDLLYISPEISDSYYIGYVATNVGNGTIGKGITILPDYSIFGLFARQNGTQAVNIEAFRPGPYDDWQIIRTNPFVYYALDYYKPDPNKMLCFRTTALAQGVYGSADRGNTWVNKTGNLVALVGALGSTSCRGLKYVWTR